MVSVTPFPPVLSGVCRRFRFGRIAVAWSIAYLMLELNRGVADMEALVKKPVDSTQNPDALGERNIGNRDVAAQGVSARAEAPDVHVMNCLDTLHAQHGRNHVIEANATGQALEE